MTLTDMTLANYNSDNFKLQYQKELTEQKSTLVMSLIGCVAMATLSGFLAGSLNFDSGAIVLYMPCCVLALCIVASMMFGPLKRKSDTIAMLMTPSSMKAKFMVRWIAVVPALLIILFLGGFLFEFSRMLGQVMYHDHTQFIMPYIGVIRMMLDDSDAAASISLVTVAVSYSLFQQGLYMIGGVVWPRLSFLKTMLALWGVQVALQIITFPLITPVIIPFLKGFVAGLGPDNYVAGIYGAAILFLILTALCWWISYRLFTKVDINRFSSRK